MNLAKYLYALLLLGDIIMKKRSVIVLVLMISFFIVIIAYYPIATGNIVVDFEPKYEDAVVLKVIDGDTFDSDLGRVRLLGINTPEKGDFYFNEAKDYLDGFVGKNIVLVSDRINLDRYDRKLSYVLYEDRLINVEILEQGLATIYMEKGLYFYEKLVAAENFARAHDSGIWQKSLEKCSSCIKLIDLDFEEEYFELENICNHVCDLTDWEAKDNANHRTSLGKINPYEIKRYVSLTSIWNNDGDRLYIRDSSGKLALFYEY